MEKKQVQTEYTLENRAKLLVDNQELSDVTFIVGEAKKPIYGHKLILAIASPVFKQMFFGDLKMDTSKSVVIPDLTSKGFLNMLRYIYGYKIDDEFKLNEIAETFTAADKYILDDLTSALLDQMTNRLNERSCIMIYDQLLKIVIKDTTQIRSLVDKVKSVIKRDVRMALGDQDEIEKVDLDTLVGLLEMEILNVDEIDLLKACSRWIRAECGRRGLEMNAKNQQELFKPIKNLIRFTEISFKELKQVPDIQQLLNGDELASLLYHLLDRSSPLMIRCQTLRTKPELLYTSVGTDYSDISIYDKHQCIVQVNVSDSVLLHSIQTSVSYRPNISIDVFVSLNDISIKCFSSMLKDEKRILLRFDQPLHLKPENDYRFVFTLESLEDDGSLNSADFCISQTLKFEGEDEDELVFFQLYSEDWFCIRKIGFFKPF